MSNNGNKKQNHREYFDLLKERSQKSRVYKKYQLTGLLMAQLLDDDKHKSLYIKLAKKHNNEHLLGIAKDVSERKKIKNKGGYFMRVLQKTHPNILKK